MDYMTERSTSHHEESPITSEEDCEVHFIKEIPAPTNDVRDGYSTSSSSSSTSSSSAGYDIFRRDKPAEITSRNVTINRTRNTFFNCPSNTFPNATATLPQAAQPLNVFNMSSSSSSDPPRLHYEAAPTQHAHIAPPTIITIQGPGSNEIPYLEDLTLSAVIAFKFNIDEARQRHPASAIHYASYIKKDIAFKLQTFASCCKGISRHAYSG